MTLDRKQPEYRVVEILLSGPNVGLRDVLDRCIEKARELGNGTATDIALGEVIDKLEASHSQRALLRLAMFFWNGEFSIDEGDLATLDEDNRERFLRAMATHLGKKWVAPKL